MQNGDGKLEVLSVAFFLKPRARVGSVACRLAAGGQTEREGCPGYHNCGGVCRAVREAVDVRGWDGR